MNAALIRMEELFLAAVFAERVTWGMTSVPPNLWYLKQ